MLCRCRGLRPDHHHRGYDCHALMRRQHWLLKLKRTSTADRLTFSWLIMIFYYYSKDNYVDHRSLIKYQMDLNGWSCDVHMADHLPVDRHILAHHVPTALKVSTDGATIITKMKRGIFSSPQKRLAADRKRLGIDQIDSVGYSTNWLILIQSLVSVWLKSWNFVIWTANLETKVDD